MVKEIILGTFVRKVKKFNDRNDSHSFVEIKYKQR